MKNPSVLPLGKRVMRAIQPEKILASIIDVVCAIDKKGQLVYVSPAAPALFGYTAEEMVGTSFAHYTLEDDVARALQAICRGLNGEQGSNWESRFVHKNGHVVDLIWSARWDEEDKLFYCVARNGAEKKALEHRLHRARNLARIAHFEYDCSSNKDHYSSDNLYEIYGIDKVVHGPFSLDLLCKLVHPDDVQMLKRHALDNPDGFIPSIDYRIIRPNGELAYINRMVEEVRDENGKLVRLIGTVQDVTDRKLTELAYQQSEARMRSVVEYGHDIIVILDAAGNYLFLSDNVERYLGYTKQDLLGKNAFDLIHWDDVPGTRDIFQQTNHQEVTNVPQFRLKNKKGEWRWLDATICNQLENPAVNGVICHCCDITEKKEKEEALKLSEQKFKALAERSADIICILDDKGNITYYSSNLLPILGYKTEEVYGRNVTEFLAEEEIPLVISEVSHIMAGTSSGKGIEHRFRHRNGGWVWFESKGRSLDGEGGMSGIVVNCRNITDRVRLQERLRLEQRNKQKEITAAVIKAQENERSQLGLELHDNVNQVLTTVKLYNEMYLSGYVPDKQLLEKSTQYTQDCINEIRSISKRLSAPTLGNISLKDSIGELVDSINITRRLHINYCAESICGLSVSEDLHLAIYRIVQEGINNILKYSQAKTAWVRLEQKECGLLLLIGDDGVGFDTGMKRGGIGITNMKTRAENVNAEFLLVSAPGEGCEISILFPVEESEG